MPITLDELVANASIVDSLSIAEFSVLYQEISNKSFSERTETDIKLAGMLEKRKKKVFS